MLLNLDCGHAMAVVYVSGLSSPKTRKALVQALPAKTKARVLGSGLLLVELDLHVAPEGHRYILCSGEVAYWPLASALIVALWEGCREMASTINYLGFVVKGFEALKSLRGVLEAELRLSDGENVQRSLVDSED